MNVSLPPTWERFVASQVSAGEFGNASEVVREALRLLRDQQERRASEELRAAFAGVDPHGGHGEPTPHDRALIAQAVRRHRQGKRQV
ncbi:MAG: type II toxin-antitoxin system ParD family antitoxin [Verrucomicrobiales bacterium]|nr:type II toxin-antitoxin system ParD family antitoxin [Verrucomicrobiales bacterium]